MRIQRFYSSIDQRIDFCQDYLLSDTVPTYLRKSRHLIFKIERGFQIASGSLPVVTLRHLHLCFLCFSGDHVYEGQDKNRTRRESSIHTLDHAQVSTTIILQAQV